MLALPRQITQCPQMISRRSLTGDRDRISVLESEWRQPANVIELRESAGDVCEHLARIRGNRIRKRIVENRDQTSARVLRIDIDRICAKSAEGDLGGAESGTTVHGKAV